MTERLYNVWMLIVEYLLADQVRRLYSVDKALFNIALDVESYPTSLFTTYGPSSHILLCFQSLRSKCHANKASFVIEEIASDDY